jgi:hypothetical protein
VEPDPTLRRIERTAVVVCLSMAAIALALPGAGVRFALGVLGGGLLSAVSYATIGSAVSGLVTALAPQEALAEGRQTPRKSRWRLVKVAGRYALLALLAYVMIARLRLHPLGLLAGVSSVVAAASVEAFRLLLKKS